MIVLIDNYDSFTWNLWHFLSDLGVEVVTIRNDEKTVEEIMAMKPDALVISPGPCTPYEAGICLDLIKHAAGKLPIMGVCLGFQSIGIAFGASLKRVDPPVHGKLSMIQHNDDGLMAGCAKPVAVTRYHSLILDRDSLPDCLKITAETESGLVMGIEHKEFPIHGLLFHPESIASVNGYRMLANFLNLAGLAPLSNSRLAELEAHTLNLAERYPEHIHA
ncbi:MAG: aminodeoxychorismate/anthranilate synthase component II [Alphaproteobacteria bacterium]|nr:aminodeoxychorismate/anthranilate synthase component II [Alphaproteobacteria bacterium]